MENVRAHAILPSDALLLVNVDLREGDLIWFGVFRRERLVRRSNSLARPTPVCIDCLGISHSNTRTVQVRGVQSATTMVDELRILLNSAEEEMLTVGDMSADGVEDLWSERTTIARALRSIWRFGFLSPIADDR